MNIAALTGRLTRDPDSRTAQSGTTVTRFTMAVDRMKKDEADFISCIAFGKTAETIAKYFSKGRMIAITGHIQTGKYDAQDGHTVYTTDVIVDRFDFLPDGEKRPPHEAPANAPKPSVPDGLIPEGFEEISSDELPF